MTRDAARSRKAADNRPESRRFERFAATAAALALALGVAPAVVSEAAAQSRSGIFINNDVLNSLGPGVAPAPLAPLAPAAPPTPLSPRSQPGYQAPVAAPAAGTNGLGFQPYGDGSFVVTRPGTLLFPPLQAPTSTLTPGFATDADNHAARARALDNAFAEGPEPSSQLLISPAPAAAGNDSVIVFMDALPPADPNADPAAAPTLVLRRPPQPAPRKPEVPAEAIAALQQPRAAEAPAALAPEFGAPEFGAPEFGAPEFGAPEFAAPEFAAPEPAEPDFAAPETPVVAELPPEAPAERTLPAPDEPAIAEPSIDEPPPLPEAAAPAGTAEVAAPIVEAAAEPMAVPAAEPVAAPAAEPVAEAALPASSESAAPATAEAPVSLLPAAPAMTAPGMAGGVQTASLTVGGVEDTSLLFDLDSTELSLEAQSELRTLAAALRSDAGGDIQVLGFASGEEGTEDQARKLALSRALKVRSFLIDEGIASARIRVRSLGDRAEGGPANRVDIKPIGS